MVKLSKLVMVFALLLSIVPVAGVQPVGAADEFDSLRDKWKTMITGGTSFSTTDTDIATRITRINTAADSAVAAFKAGSDRTSCNCLFNGIDFKKSTASTAWDNSAEVTGAFSKLREMALAYSTLGSTYYNDATLIAKIKDGVDWMVQNVYTNNNTNQFDNWWEWEIGAPLQLEDILIMTYSNYTAAQISGYVAAINYYSPDPTLMIQGTTATTGANRVWKVAVVALSGVISKSSTKLTVSRNALSPVFTYVTSGDGFYTDGSFLQHTKHAYNGGYGSHMLKDISNIMYLLSGSTYAVTDTNQINVYKWVSDSFEPFIYNGAMMDMVRGREIARSYWHDFVAGFETMQAILRLSGSAPTSPTNYAASFKSMLKYWIPASASAYNFYKSVDSIDYIVRGKALVADSSVTSRGELLMGKVFNNSDKAVQYRPGYGFGISLFSGRIYNYESINAENMKGWYMSHGQTYLYNSDQTYYNQDYWSTMDFYHLPGTTVNTRVRNNYQAQSTASSKNWAGGSSINGYVTVGMELADPTSALTGKKSYFLFDNELVALGAGVTDTATVDANNGNAPVYVHTTIDDRKLNSTGNNTFTVNGTAQSTSLTQGVQSLTGVNWAHIAGNTASGSDLGYYFPIATSLKTERLARTGSWFLINVAGSSTAVTKNYLNMYVDHGTAPTNATYSYVLLPNRTVAQTSTYATNPDITVLRNDAVAQAVKENSVNSVGANFWTDSQTTINVGGSAWLSSDKKASIMTKDWGTSLDVSSADPTQSNTGVINVEIQKSASGVISKDANVTVVQTSPTIKFSVNVNGTKGNVAKVKFNLATATRYEAESAALTGVTVATSKAGYSGTGHLLASSFDATGDKIVFSVNALSAGTYQLRARYAAIVDKAQYLKVNGISLSNITFPNSSDSWTDLNYGNITLNTGSNSIEISKFFGWTDIDYIEISQ